MTTETPVGHDCSVTVARVVPDTVAPVRLTVLGTGYLGATHAACLADLGHEVLGYDIDADKVRHLNAGHVPFFEPGLPEVLHRALASGRLRFTTDIAEVGAFSDVHFICVGTPQSPGSDAADMSQVHEVVEAVLPHLQAGSLIVGKSTVPVGTASALLERMRATAPTSDLAWNPEFLREGFAVADTMTPDRIVVGVTTAQAEARLREIYQPMLQQGVPFLVTDFATAELVKVAANAFLATKISFINAMAEVSEAAGADVTALAEAIGYDDRIGHRFLRAGIGYGGGCLPKDLRAFVARAGELGAAQSLGFLREVDAVNRRRREHTVDLAVAMLEGQPSGATVSVLGATFKPDSDDVRDSPALDIAAALQAQGARVRVHDPEGIETARRRFPTLDYREHIHEAIAGTDLVMHLTEWRVYQDLDPATLPAVSRKRLLDGRLTLDVARWRDAGWEVRVLGRPRV